MNSACRYCRCALQSLRSLCRFGGFGRYVALVFLLSLAGHATARSLSEISEINRAQLPYEAQQTLQRIQHGGPFAYSKDGTVFGNRERRLARQPRGYYTEYTVKTPGARDRGARRIIAGAGHMNDPRISGEYYYTDDHYQSFRRIRGLAAAPVKIEP